ncbi:hypothetical protein AZH53_02485 [Methanomicrobiaceae archaeon CYW5]|uniref:hypothetical protein n=1 Tax=Methanovulcanius yangii TaxID=1789227 RepID=UPI0029CA3138|nr:hypothetical protein [Methanovulcanius yangii]MBT8507297.1 hypothetical protein [Methanovulcanius yangii]
MERTIGLLATLLLILSLANPATGVVVQTFWPGQDSIVSCDVRDIAESHDGMVAFATSSGISMFDGGWTSTHRTPWDYERGMRDDYLTSLSFDVHNYLWIGYGAGVQTYNGEYFNNIDEGQFFQHMPIHDILRAGEDIWIAIGNSGLQRYSEDSWTWYRPFTSGGLDAYCIDSLACDHQSGSIYALSANNGLWRTSGEHDNQHFEKVSTIPDIDSIAGITDYPFGGVIVYTDKQIHVFSTTGNLTTLVIADDLGPEDIRFRDVEATEDAALLIGTNNGMYVVADGKIRQHISQSTGELQNNKIIKVFQDSMHRYWFVTPYETGFFTGDIDTRIPIEYAEEYPNTSAPETNHNLLEIQIIYTENR